VTASQQNPDGSWGPAEPLPYAPGIDWEISGRGRGRVAVAYWKDQQLAVVPAGRLFGLRLRLCHRALRRLVAAQLRRGQLS